MREILFRGKRIDTKEWAYGHHFEGFTGISYILVLHDHILGMTEFYEVILETIGQFTGLTDKNGNKIFEGDIVRIEDFVNAAVKWREDIACFTLQGYIIGNTWDSSMLEVIGNIHDNPELLK